MIKSPTILTRRSIFRAGAGLAVAATATPFLTPASAQAKDAPQAGAESIQMAKDTHVTAPTRFVEVGGIRYAYRRFGAETGTPLVFLQHFRGGLDNWDPLVTDLLAQERPVILFNNAGVASSTGETPNTIDAMGDHVAAFVNALGLPQVDVLGFSIGGYVAQSFVLRHPHLVRRLVLAGTGPRNGEPRTNPRVSEVAANPVPVCEDFLFLFFSPSEAGQAAGRAFWERRHQRKDADPPSSPQTMKAQQEAAMEWRELRGKRYADLKSIKQPTLVVNGNDDIMVPTINSFTLSQHIPNAQLILYPDSGHGALFQYPELFVAHTKFFLDA
jgi:pimeloyl-ACP methyl ester carboxylesterase